MPTITSVDVIDIRFPTSATRDGSDAMNPDGDYSAAYVVLETGDDDLAGYGLTFTIGRGNDLCVAAARQIGARLAGRDVDELAADLGGLYREIMSDSQMRWLGPEKGVVHLAAAAVLNAAWDLAARRAGKPLWRLVADMSPEDLVAACDFRYLSEALTPAEAVDMLARLAPTREERVAVLAEYGYPAYTTSPGWLGYDDDTLRRLCREAVADGWTHVKLKVGADVEDDMRRLAIAREEIGDRTLMIDANQVWDVPEAIAWVNRLAPYEPLWIEEPTSPDDVLGHAAIRKAVAPVGVATGEHCHNRVMFKQLLQAGAIDFCQVDSCRLASVNEIVPVLLMAAKFGVPVCPHAGGVGLCELVQHVSVIDYVCVSGSLEGRVLEYVDHLHEHFTDPVRVERGRYRLPEAPGYGARMHAGSVDGYRYPDGLRWGG
ncbi:enolase C-terminal domain-like protein [Microbispora sp. ATCC PTA-5024]|uniref:enolase C-terminal domain-like protein n=1 Tax=Microbispora sp. ATCC PTA-5024 TaxID=316330 RepID=UPI0003DD8794|nr:enolase C-terminal domain-like protein [Microbispora sp. ATCC PTA-5024]ETK36912.1 fuconate dehydratase [Microbispora sp. ATCC PTA-5024]